LVGAAGPGRGRPGCRHHLIRDADVSPLVVSSTGDDRNDIPQLLPLLDGSRRSADCTAGPASCPPAEPTTTASTAVRCAPADHPAHRAPRRRPRLWPQPSSATHDHASCRPVSDVRTSGVICSGAYEVGNGTGVRAEEAAPSRSRARAGD
jgi:hypothetical protein